MHKPLVLLLLTSGCYFGPGQGEWLLNEVIVDSIECVEDGFDGPVFPVGESHQLLKNSYPLMFDFSIQNMNWEGGDMYFPCTLADRVFSCDYHYMEWRNGPEGKTPMDEGLCTSSNFDPETQSCWSQGMSMEGTFTGDEDQTLEANFTYVLSCLNGYGCLLTPGDERCAAKLSATYTYSP